MLKRTISRVAYSFVMADLLHYGHLRLLKTAKEQADYHICGLISDEACHIWQGMNISNYDERKGVLESLDCVDEIIKQETMDPTENLKAVPASTERGAGRPSDAGGGKQVFRNTLPILNFPRSAILLLTFHVPLQSILEGDSSCGQSSELQSPRLLGARFPGPSQRQ